MSADGEHSAPGHIIPFSYTLGTFVALLFEMLQPIFVEGHHGGL